MDINKAIFRGVRVAFILMLVVLIVYGTMKASFAAYDFGYRYAMEHLTGTISTTSVDVTESTEESTGE